MRRHASLAIVLLASCADERAPTNRGVAGPEAVAASAPAPAEAAEDPFAPSATPFARPRTPPERPRAVVGPVETGVVPSGAPTAPAAPGSPPSPRDDGAELRARLGNPASCFSAASGLPDRVSVALTVVFGASGRATRAEVSAPGLPTSDVACLRDRALGVQLSPSDADAPRTVRTTLEVERRAAASTR